MDSLDLPLPLPPKNKVPLRRMCGGALRIVTYMAHNRVYPVLPFILSVPGDAQIHYALLIHYYRIRGYTPPLRKTKLTEEEKQEIVRLYMQGMSQAGIADRTGRSIGSVHSVIVILGKHKPKHRKYKRITKAEREAIVQAKASGMTLRAIANKTGRSIGTIWKILHKKE